MPRRILEIRIQPSYNLQNKALQDKAYFVPQPIFHSYLVKANPKLKTTFQALDIKTLGDLFNSVTNHKWRIDPHYQKRSLATLLYSQLTQIHRE